jgi:hypothetical protein
VFWEKRLQPIENKGREREKERKERYKRLQAAENMRFATEALRPRDPDRNVAYTPVTTGSMWKLLRTGESHVTQMTEVAWFVCLCPKVAR